MTELEKKYVDMIDDGESFEENETREFLWECGQQVDEIDGYPHRWDQEIKTVIQIEDRFFAVDWRRGLTECQENSFYDPPYEVTLTETQKTITVREWNPIEKEK